MSAETGILFEAAGVSKSFAGTAALSDVGLVLRRGRVHALVGENGAGKSTLVKIISGGLPPDSGLLRLEGRPFAPSSPAAAQRLGVAAVHQELSLVPYLPVYQNLWLGHSGAHGHSAVARQPFVRRDELRRRSRELGGRYGRLLPIERWVEELSLEEQQVVEILKALALDPALIIFDEPTSALGAANTRWLLDLVARLKGEGRAVLFISHRLPEIMELADEVTVLKDGRKVGTAARAAVTEDDVVRMMVGRDLADIFPQKADPAVLETRPPLLRAGGLIAEGVHGVSFALREGEVVGLAGLEGQGQHELMLALFGLRTLRGGAIQVQRRAVARERAGGARASSSRKGAFHHPLDAMREGVALVPVDRRTEGVILPLSVAENIALPTLRDRQRMGWVDRGREARAVRAEMERLSVHARGPQAPVQTLSGGNQQKVALAKWLAAEPRVLLLDDPTRGVDIETRRDIYHLVRRLAEDGRAALLNSTDVIELVGMCDRVLVMYEGRIVRELAGREIGEEAIVAAAVGVGNGQA